MARADEKWFEEREIDGRRHKHVSKFYGTEFAVSPDFVKARWRSWSRRERGLFGAAFAARHKLLGADRGVLDFLMDNGGDEVQSLIAQLVAREHPDRDRALAFLLSRVQRDTRPLANFYQALGILGAPECVQELRQALIRRSRYVNDHPTLHWWKMWQDRLNYLDYLFCSAALFQLTGEERYRTNVKAMLEHRNKAVRQMARTVAVSSEIEI